MERDFTRPRPGSLPERARTLHETPSAAGSAGMPRSASGEGLKLPPPPGEAWGGGAAEETGRAGF